MEEIVRNIGEGKIAIDTVSVQTATYDIGFLNLQKQQLENELANVNALIARFDIVKEKEVNLETPNMEVLVGINENK